MSDVKGVLENLKLNATQQKKDGSTYKAHLVLVDGQKFVIHAGTETGKKIEPYLAKLKVGETVTVCRKDDQYGTVYAVKPEFKPKSDYKPGAAGGYKKPFVASAPKAYDPTGPIQGMVLAAAISKCDVLTVDNIVNNAKIILKAKSVIDKMVVDHIKGVETKTTVTDEFSDVDEDVAEVSDDFTSEEDPF